MMKLQPIHEEYLATFEDAIQRMCEPICTAYGWRLKRIKPNEFAIEGPQCSMHILLYFGHCTNIVLFFQPNKRIRKIIGHDMIGIYRVVPEHDYGTREIMTHADIAASLEKHMAAINSTCVKLMEGDIEQWLMYKPVLDQAKAEAVQWYNSMKERARARYRRIHGDK